MHSRRRILQLGLVAAGAPALAACGPNQRSGGGSASGSDANSLRVVWWGNNERTRVTQKAMDAFTARESGVTIKPEPTEWGGYWDKLATQLAANDAPDVVQMDEKYLLEYADRGALLDLGSKGLQTDGLETSTVDLGRVDGKLYAVSAGTIAPVMMANPALFEEAKVDLPNDATWTWEQLRELGTELTRKLGKGRFGVTDFSGRDAAFRVWIRQCGAESFKDGKLGFDADVATDYFALCRSMLQQKASPSASQSAEDVSASVAQRLFATKRTALAIYSSNQITAFDAASGGDIQLLRLPSRSGSAKAAKLSHQASMFWTVTAGSAAGDTAVKLINFFINDTAAGRIQLTERGVPVNAKVLTAVQKDLTRSDRKALTYLEKIKGEQAGPPPLTPKGGSTFEDVLIRHGQEVLFGRQTPQQAGRSFVDEMSSALG